MHTFRQFLEFNSTLEYHDQLNPALWNNGQLDPVVRTHLLAIAYEWQHFANITADMVHDIIITGGNVNYNYTPESDIDVHILINRKALGIANDDLAVDYIKAKKDLWADKHKIQVKGYPVELYAQDINEVTPKDQGVYSILYNKWLVKPENKNLEYDDPDYAKGVEHFIHQINSTIKSGASVEAAKLLKAQITGVRGEAIRAEGEFAKDNLIFKDLRNRGYLDKLQNYIKKLEDAKLSL